MSEGLVFLLWKSAVLLSKVCVSVVPAWSPAYLQIQSALVGRRVQGLTRVIKVKAKADKIKHIDDQAIVAQEASKRNDHRTLYSVVKDMTPKSFVPATMVALKDGSKATSVVECRRRWQDCKTPWELKSRH